MPKPTQNIGVPLRYLPYALRRQGLNQPYDENTFAGGMTSDTPTSAMAQGYAPLLQDWLTNTPGKLVKRGGSTYASDPLTGNDIVVMVANMPFANDPSRTVAIASSGASQKAYDITGMGSALVGTIDRTPSENPPFWQDMLIVTDGFRSPSVIPKKVWKAGGTMAVLDLGSTGITTVSVPPVATCSCVHLNRLVLGGGDINPQRIYFSQLGDPDDWTVANNWIDTDAPVIGLASIEGVLCIFHRNGCQRVLNDIPPGYGTAAAPENMQIEPMDAAGCFDARSIVRGVGGVYFAHESGIYFTNGSAAQSITSKSDGSGISEMWRVYSVDLDPTTLGHVCCAGIYSNDWLLVSMRHPAGPDFQIICYLPTNAWTSTSLNIAANSYASLEAPNAALYATNSNAGTLQVLNLTTLFNPYPGPPADHDGNAVVPILETRMIGDGNGLKAYFDSHLTFDMRVDTGTPPVMHVSVSKGVEAPSFVEVAESPLAATTTAERHRYTVSKDAQAVSYKFAQANKSERTEIYAVESLYRNYYGADNW